MDRHDKDLIALALLAAFLIAGGLNGINAGMSDYSWLVLLAGLVVGAVGFVRWSAARRATAGQAPAASARTPDEHAPGRN
ncbi:MAG TPA: hypothetical protein VK045_01775 [Ornithinicoccus sp.]|nr:hypothetical protein [Ornithinicoccus sp.]